MSTKHKKFMKKMKEAQEIWKEFKKNSNYKNYYDTEWMLACILYAGDKNE